MAKFVISKKQIISLIKEDVNIRQSIEKYLNAYLNKKWTVIHHSETKSDWVLDISNNKWVIRFDENDAVWYNTDYTNLIFDMYDISDFYQKEILAIWIGEIFKRKPNFMFNVGYGHRKIDPKILDQGIIKNSLNEQQTNDKLESILIYLNTFLKRKWSIIHDPIMKYDWVIDIENKNWIIVLHPFNNNTCWYNHNFFSEICELFDTNLFDVKPVINYWAKQVFKCKISTLGIKPEYEINRSLKIALRQGFVRN